MAIQLSDLQHLIRQLGPSLPEISTIIEEDVNSWEIVFDTDLSLQISWQEMPVRVLLCCAVGKPAENNRETLFARLLNLNLLMQGVANLKLALSSPEDDVILIGELESDSLSLELLQTEIAHYLGYAAHFSGVINQSKIDSEESNSSPVMSFELFRA